jgi:hypothetical protein
MLLEWRYGPLSIADVTSFHAGYGTGGPSPWGAGVHGLRSMDVNPSWFSRGVTGAREVALRVHWDSEAAARTGGQPHLYAQQQASLIANVLMPFVGSHGWLAALDVRHRAPVLVGSETRISARLTSRTPPYEVRVELTCATSSGRATGTAVATLLVPRSSGSEAPPLPAVPDDPFAVGTHE